jgi:hypothetical protein
MSMVALPHDLELTPGALAENTVSMLIPAKLDLRCVELCVFRSSEFGIVQKH